ncbi:MAG: putative rane protein [Actinomycetota bacterium]|nr:putative rane protein [Actinomycetota bacterium]
MSFVPGRWMRSIRATVPRPSLPAGSRRRAVATWGGLLTVPLLVAGLLAWAFGGGLQGRDAVAAVVNNDEPVTVEGRTVPLGRQLAQTLVHGDDRRYRWVLTNDADAGEGLKNGDYAAVVTIPAEFSRLATSAATTKDPLTAASGVITVATSRDTAVADALVSKDVATAAASATADEVLQTYLDNVYIGFTTIHGKIGEAADGAVKLADGTGRASDGSRQVAKGTGDLTVGLGALAKGAGQAASGATTLSTGAQKLKTGTAQLATGAGQLATGTKQLSAGAGQLATGLDTLATKTAEMPEQTRLLADGARQVADGNAKLADQVVPVADKVITVIDAVPDLDHEAGKLDKVVKECANLVAAAKDAAKDAAAKDPAAKDAAKTVTVPKDLCDDVKEVTSELQQAAGTVEKKKKDVRGQIVVLRDGVVALKKGSAQVADGNEKLADAAPALVDGIGQAATAGHQLATGAKSAATGATQLAGASTKVATGTADLASGTRTLAGAVTSISSGSSQAVTGARRLRTGTRDLASGLKEVDQGADTLAGGLDSSRGQVPSYSEGEREHLKQVAAAPALVDDESGDVVRSITGSFFVVIALWIGAMATFVVRRAVPAGTLTSRAPTALLVLRGVAPGLAVSAAGAAVLGAGLGTYLGLGAGRCALVAGAAVLAGIMLTLCNQGLVALFGRYGRLTGVAVLVVTSAVSIVSATPAVVRGLESFFPTHDAVTVIRSAIDGVGVAPALAKLLIWTLIGVVTIAYVTERKRSLPRSMLRLEPGRREPLALSPSTNPLPLLPPSVIDLDQGTRQPTEAEAEVPTRR